MKIKKLAIIILMTTFFIILGTKVYASTGKINSETVRLRKEPNTKSTILDQLDKGEEVEILEQEEGWYKVKVKTEQGNISGYISETLIDVEKESEETVNTETPIEQETEQEIKQPEEDTTNTQENNEATSESISTDIVSENVDESINIEENKQYTLEQEISVKVLPLINSREKAKISGNIEIIEIINDWSKIESDTEGGWIRTNTLNKSLIKIEETGLQQEQQTEQQSQETVPEQSTTEETIKTEEPETTLNKVGYVDAEGLIIRKEPNTSSEELHSLSRNDKVEIIGQSGKWYKISWNGETGYVSAKYISDTKVPETTSRSGSTLKNETTTNTEEETEQEELSVTSTTQKQETAGTTGTSIVEYAKQYLGYKYVSGGASPSTGFDCSGFTSYVYKHFGISLYRASRDQIKNGVAVEKSDLQPGDLVIFNNDANTAIGHVGIYVGNGNFIHASNPSDGVKITTLTSGYYQKRYVGARRVI